MKLSLVSIAAAVASAFAVTEAAVTGFVELKDFAVQLMDTAESTFTGDEAAGATKLESVLAATEAVAKAIGVDWNPGLEASLTTFISAAKGAYNAVSAVVSPAPAAPVAAVPVAQPVEVPVDASAALAS